MGDSIPETTNLWRVTGYNGFDSLKFMEESIPELGDGEVLVKSEYFIILLKRIAESNGLKFAQRP
jgi:hypothetical protein